MNNKKYPAENVSKASLYSIKTKRNREFVGTSVRQLQKKHKEPTTFYPSRKHKRKSELQYIPTKKHLFCFGCSNYVLLASCIAIEYTQSIEKQIYDIMLCQ